MTSANSPNNNLSPWQPGQSGNPGGMPKGTRDLCPSKIYWGATGGRLVRLKSWTEPTT